MAKSDDKANIPWSVKGVSKEARQMAKKAAAAEGLTMGEWLSRAIRADGDPSVPAAGDGDAEATTVEAGSSMVTAPPVAPAELDEGARRKIVQRVAESEERILGVVQPLQDIIQEIAVRIEALEQRAERGSQQSLPRPAASRKPAYRKTGWD